MIQRIQSVYLLVIGLLFLLLFFVPIMTIDFYLSDNTPAVIEILPFGITQADMSAGGVVIETIPTIWYGILVVLTTVLPIAVIFMYKNRWLQMRLIIADMVLQLGVMAFMAYYIYKGYMLVESLNAIAPDSALPPSLSLVCVVPLVTLILSYLAFRGVIRDEMLIRSLNRIR